MKRQIGHLKGILIFTIILSVIVGGLLSYNKSLADDLEETACEELNEIIGQQKYNLKMMIEDRFSSIKTLSKVVADTMGQMDEYDKTETYNLFQDVGKESGFQRIILADVTGIQLTEHNIDMDIAEEDFFKSSVTGETCLSKPYISGDGNKKVVYFATPVITSKNISAVLIGEYGMEQFSKLFPTSYNKKGFVYLCERDGTIIAASDTQEDMGAISILRKEKSSNLSYLNFDTFEEIWSNIENGSGGHSVYDYKERTELLHYEPVGINDWYIISTVPKSVIGAEAMQITNNALYLTTVIVLVLMILAAVYYRRQKKYEKVLYEAAYIDELTGLPNLVKFKLDMEQIWEKHSDMNFMILKFDIHQFKMFNEKYGFDTGDRIIQLVAQTSRIYLKEEYDILTRINADTFVLMCGYDKLEEAENKRIQAVEAFKKAALEIADTRVEFRFGRYLIPKEDRDVKSVLEKVNLAHGLSKETYPAGIFDYDEDQKARIIEETDIESKMEQALEQDEFLVYLQPKVSLITEKIVGAEALVRWKRKGEGIAYPNQFISLFEKNGFITRLDMYVLDKVCKIIVGWREKGEELIPVSVNFSRIHLKNPRFVLEIEEIVSRYNIPRKYIEIELTENTMLDNEEILHDVSGQLRQYGYTLSMDDFGSGYSSLGLLKSLPVDIIKVDRTFFLRQGDAKRSKIVIESMIQMAEKMGISTVAEGVESGEYIDFLKTIGCDMVQSYYYGKPIPSDNFSADMQIKSKE